MNQIMQLFRDNANQPKQVTNLLNKADTTASLYIYDMISADWGVSALEVVDAINQAGDAKVLNVHINSPGGDVFEGRAIMAAISAFRGKTVAKIDSLCASAATSIALACDEIEMAEGAAFMIHNAKTLAYGDKSDLRHPADVVEKIESAIVNDYTSRTGKDEAEIRAAMQAETWFTAAEALEYGFVDRVTGKTKVKNTWNLAAFGNAPKTLLNATAPDPVEQADSAEGLNEDERNFLEQMIPHHEAAIEMARGILPSVENDDVRDLVQGIIHAQAGEIALMQTWLGSDGETAVDNKKKPMKPMKMQAAPPGGNKSTQKEPAPEAGFFMSAANANRLRLAQIA